MTNRPQVSVIMPAYNAERTISDSIRSVKSQTLTDWELIILDDGSSDETLRLARTHAERDRRIRVISQRNSGPSIARNRGVEEARADVVAFLDADDRWAAERLAGCMRIFSREPDIGVVFSRTRFMDQLGERLGTLSPAFKKKLCIAQLMAENPACSTSNFVCRRAVFEDCGGFARDLHFAEDQEWLLRVALEGRWDICGVNAEWFFYRSSAESQSSDLEKMREGWGELMRRAMAAYPEQATPHYHIAYAPFHRYLARRALRMGRPSSALNYLGMAIRHEPLIILRQPKRTLLTLAGACLSCLPHPLFKELVAK